MLTIYIPSTKREQKQLTWKKLPPTLRRHAFIVVPRGEGSAYQAANTGANILECPLKGIAPTRDWIIKHAGMKGNRYLVQLDDDLDLQRRREDMRITNVTTGPEYVEAFDWIETNLVEYGHCGWGTRFLAYKDERQFFENARMMYCLAYDIHKVQKAKAKFTRGLEWNSTMEDFNMTIQMLKAGFKNKVSLEWRASPRGTNASGGCSTWRTTSCASESAKKLEQMYPGLVMTRPKKAWAGMEEGLLDVTVRWKKAYTEAA
jgi:hypothetical protein